MEQNKVLMIIVSVAIFFAAIVGVGVALLYPRGDSADLVAEGRATEEFDPIEYVRRPEQAPLTEAEEEDPVIIVYGDREEGAEDTGDTTVSTETPPSSERTITVEPARPTGDDAVEEPMAPEVTETRESPAVTTSDTESTAPTTGEAIATGRSVPDRRPEPRRIRVTEYWIQLIASPNRDRVEQVRGTLADYSLGGRVTTRDVDGELYYRLRVGPYSNQDEAEKFLSWIQDIEGFENAYISEEYPLRTVNG